MSVSVSVSLCVCVTERVNVCAGTGFYVVLVDLFLMHIHPIAVEIEQ